ncbi:MAG: formate dehydrogenase accessory sulfurtransferase FdhD [Thermodesulfobacteriota bacterium]
MIPLDDPARDCYYTQLMTDWHVNTDPTVEAEESAVEVSFQRYQTGSLKRTAALLAQETALEIVINGRSHSLLMQTPGRERELAVGYLFTEGLIEHPSQIGDLTIIDGGAFFNAKGRRVHIRLPHLESLADLPPRTALSLSSCGLCGKQDLEKVGRGLSRIKSRQLFAWTTLMAMVEDLGRHQRLYDLTKGVHAVALYQADGAYLCCFEDVGRHNALDKAIGWALEQGLTFKDKLALLSGRASLEMIIKTVRAGLPLLLCLSSPTVLAVEAAKSLNLTLIGLRKDGSLGGFSHTRRLK